MARSLWQATDAFARSGFATTGFEEFKRRLSLCAGCPHWDSRGFVFGGRCRLCGCATSVKLRMATATCPAGKWAAAN